MPIRRMKQRMTNKGKLIVISGPSGVGKGTVIRRILSECENIK